MAEVISNQNIARHNVDKYNFKVLALGSGAKRATFKSFDKEELQQSAPQENPTAIQQASSSQSDSSKDSIIESLLKKTDEMSSNFIKLQMKLESMQEEHKKELEMLKQNSLEEGILKGKEEAKKECETKYNETLTLFTSSISKLESKANEYNSELEKLKNELTSAALDIAKEVVSIELDEHSNQVAEALANSLIEDLQNASKITLKVNPKDFTHISQNFQELQHIKVVADSAVNEGGVIAISDIENIDAQIQNRFERVKRVILSE